MSAYDAVVDHVSALVQAGALPTAVIGVATRDGVQVLEARGRTGPRTARTGDHYRLFSITKPLVGLVAARELERGTLTLDTPLTEALPGFGARRDDVVRLRHLASHTSGITEPELDDARPLREALVSAGRDTEAGTLRRYSSLAFEGIAAPIEHASGSTWESRLDRLNVDLGTQFTLDEAADPPPVLGLEEFDMPGFGGAPPPWDRGHRARRGSPPRRGVAAARRRRRRRPGHSAYDASAARHRHSRARPTASGRR